MTPFGRELSCRQTGIAGLTVWSLPVHGDERGFFKENWQRAAMVAAGLPQTVDCRGGQRARGYP